MTFECLASKYIAVLHSALHLIDAKQIQSMIGTYNNDTCLTLY